MGAMTPDWLKQLAEASWAQADPEGQHPPRIPDVTELAAFVRDHATHADHTECSERLLELLTSESYAKADKDTRITCLKEALTGDASLPFEGDCPDTISLPLDQMKHQADVDTIRDFCLLATKQAPTPSKGNALLVSMSIIHAAWESWGRPFGIKHALAPYVKAWKNLPSPIKPNTRNDRTISSRIAHVDVSDRRSGTLFTPATHRVVSGERKQGVLPGWPDRPRRHPALPLALYDLGIGAIKNRGGGAPLALRLWVEAILSVPMEERDTPHPVSMEVDLRTIRKRLWPKSWRGYSTDRLRYVLEDVANGLDSWDAAWPWHDPTTGKSGTRRIVYISDIGKSLDDVMRIIIDLPPGAATGPQVPATLGQWGAKDAAAYRALLNLAFQWYEPGRTHIPVGNRSHRHWARVYDPSRYPELDEQDVIDLAYPTTKDSNQRRAFQEAMNALETLEVAGELHLLGKRGKLRILPSRDGTD